MSNPNKEEQSEKSLEEIKCEFMKKRFKNSALVLLGVFVVFLALLPFAC